MKKMIKCKNCGKVYPINLSNCPECFAKNKQLSINVVVGIFLAIFVFVFIFPKCFLLSITQAGQNDRTAA